MSRNLLRLVVVASAVSISGMALAAYVNDHGGDDGSDTATSGDITADVFATWSEVSSSGDEVQISSQSANYGFDQHGVENCTGTADADGDAWIDWAGGEGDSPGTYKTQFSLRMYSHGSGTSDCTPPGEATFQGLYRVTMRGAADDPTTGARIEVNTGGTTTTAVSFSSREVQKTLTNTDQFDAETGSVGTVQSGELMETSNQGYQFPPYFKITVPAHAHAEWTGHNNNCSGTVHPKHFVSSSLNPLIRIKLTSPVQQP